MKKNKGLIIFLSIVLFSLAIYVGLAIITYQNDLNVLISILLQILGIVIILPIFVAVHELGHMVFGLMSGYSLLSFKLGPFEWYRKENKISFKINPPSNIILGQCLMLPPKPKKKKAKKIIKST